MATTTDTKVSTHVLDVNAAQLHRILSDAALFTGKDAKHPFTTGVHIETDSRRMIAVATERHVLGCSWVDLDGTTTGGVAMDNDGCAFNLSPSDLAILIKVSKTPNRGAARIVSLIQNYDGTIEFKFWSGETITVKHFDHQFPQWRRLIPDTGKEVPRTAFGFTQDLIAKFSKVDATTKNHQIAIFSFDEAHDSSQKKPYVVRIGDNFIGLIMPARLNEACDWRKPEWL